MVQADTACPEHSRRECPPHTFSSAEKFPNKDCPMAVFMNEGKRLVVGQAIWSEAATVGQSQDELLEDLVRQHARLVYRIAYAVLRRHHDAEDATQETFVRVLRYSSKLAAVEDHKTWLARIAWRVAVDRSKRHARRRAIALEDPERLIEEVVCADVPADEAILGKE